jgi:hypothetical protein
MPAFRVKIDGTEYVKKADTKANAVFGALRSHEGTFRQKSGEFYSLERAREGFRRRKEYEGGPSTITVERIRQ